MRAVGYSEIGATTQIPLLRSVQLSSDTILCFFEGVLAALYLREPPEQMHHGLTLQSGNYGISTLSGAHFGQSFRTASRPPSSRSNSPRASSKWTISHEPEHACRRPREYRERAKDLGGTNRSVTLTAAGEELQAALMTPFEAIGAAAESLNRFRDAPAGRIRLNVPSDAANLLLGPVLPTFIDRYPDVQIDLAVSNHLIDVIEGGFDAGIRYGGTVPEDMIAQRLSADIGWVVAGSPQYLDRFGIPKHPNDLQHHRCLRFRLGDERVYRWEFDCNGEQITIDVPGSITLDDSRSIVALLLGGAGLMYGPEPLLAPLVKAGAVRLVLENWTSPGPGFHIYYSSHRQVPVGLRLLIDLIRELQPLGL